MDSDPYLHTAKNEMRTESCPTLTCTREALSARVAGGAAGTGCSLQIREQGFIPRTSITHVPQIRSQHGSNLQAHRVLIWGL